MLARDRLIRAQIVIRGICELGSDLQIGTEPPAQVRKALEARIQKLRQAADRPFSGSASPDARVNRAALMIQLDRFEDAEELLRPLTPDNNVATLLLATVYRDQERWPESDELYTTALEKLGPLAGTETEARAGCMTALDGLAFNARGDHRPNDAERVLRQGIELLPMEAAYFHFQLGRHYADGGRPHLAIECFRTAATLDRSKFGDVANQQIGRLQTHTHGCLTGLMSKG